MFAIRSGLPLAALVLGACTVDTLPAAGRPCSDQQGCGPGTYCSPPPGPRTCVQGPRPSPDLAVQPDAALADAPSSPEDLGPSLDQGPPPDLPPPDLVPAPDCPTCPAGLSCVNGACACIQGGACAGCCKQNSCFPPGSAQSVLICGNGGEPCKSCDDGVSCSTDTCVNGSCKNTIQPGYCLIQKTCYKDGDSVSSCYRCVLAQSALWATLVGEPGCVTTLAGDGVPAVKNGPALSARFDGPRNLAVDSAGAIYVADMDNHCIRVITGAPGSYTVSTLAGDGVASFADGPAATARFSQPSGVAVDSSGVVYVADADNQRIRMITGAPGSYTVSTVAGTGAAGMQDGPATSAKFYSPRGVAVDGAGQVYVADANNQRIRVITGAPGSYTVSTLAGSGAKGFQDGPATTARFSAPADVAVDSSGKLIVVADMGNNRVRTITETGGSYTVSTAAGSGAPGFQDGPSATARFDTPLGVTMDNAGKIYVADGDNSRVRLIAAGVVSTVAGSGGFGFQEGPVSTARFSGPAGVALLPGGLVVADLNNNRIRMVHF